MRPRHPLLFLFLFLTPSIPSEHVTVAAGARSRDGSAPTIPIAISTPADEPGAPTSPVRALPDGRLRLGAASTHVWVDLAPDGTATVRTGRGSGPLSTSATGAPVRVGPARLADVPVVAGRVRRACVERRAGPCVDGVEVEAGEVWTTWTSTAVGPEQGWTVARLHPSGATRLHVPVDRGAAVFDAATLVLGTPGDGYRLIGLAAWDAAGRVVPASFEGDDDGFAVVLDTHDAEAPVRVDPTWVPWPQEIVGTIAWASFAETLRDAGDVNGDGYGDVLVGAHRDPTTGSDAGRVDLYLGSPTGLSPTPVDQAWGTSFERLGEVAVASVDLDDDGYDDVVTGYVNAKSTAALVHEGRLKVFRGGPDGLDVENPVLRYGGTAYAELGGALSAPGDLTGDGIDDLVVSAHYTDPLTLVTSHPQVQVWPGSPTGLAAAPAWSYDLETSGRHLGGDFDGDGRLDLLVVSFGLLASAPQPNTIMGSLDVDLSGGAVLDGVLDLNLSAPSDPVQAGFSLLATDLDDDGFDDIVLGDPNSPYADYTKSRGTIAVYRGTASGPSLLPERWVGTSVGDSQGRALTLVRRADGVRDMVFTPVGYSPSALRGSWPDPVRLLGDPATLLDDEQVGFGIASASSDVDGDGDGDLIVGDQYPQRQGSTSRNFGRVTVYFGGGPQWVEPPPRVVSDDRGDDFGSALAVVGDLDDDGFDDVLVGAPGRHVGDEALGAVVLLRGSRDGLEPVPAQVIEGFDADARFGASMSADGDVDADGLRDLVVGTRPARASSTSRAAYLFVGASDGFAPAPLQAWSEAADEGFGHAVRIIPDVDGDGDDEVAVSSPYGFTPVDLFRGEAGGVGDVSAWQAHVTVADGGLALHGCDVDGDGYGDLLLPRALANPAFEGPGSVEVFLGGATGLATARGFDLVAPTEDYDSTSVGASAACVDLDGDDVLDVLLGAPGADDAADDGGTVQAFLGGPAFDATADATWSGATRLERFGATLATGDFDGNGEVDLLAGTTGGSGSAGRDSPMIVQLLQHDGQLTDTGPVGTWFHRASALVGPGDVNGDGWDDVVVGQAPCAFTDDAGCIYTLFGGPDGLRTTAPCVLDPGLCGAIDPDRDDDTVDDGDDVDPDDPFACRDVDEDGCDDCATLGQPDDDDDGADLDDDGACDLGDADDDGDTVADGEDVDPADPHACRDSDLDGCDDCVVLGHPDPASDGADLDDDGACDLGDADDDGDTVGDGEDVDAADPHACRDTDLDGCDDCAVLGHPDPASDGPDPDRDGVCSDPPPADGGCGCDSGGRSASVGPALAAALLAWSRRRRLRTACAAPRGPRSTARS